MEFNSLTPPLEFDANSSLGLLEKQLLEDRDALGTTDPEEIYANAFLPADKPADTTIVGGIGEGLKTVQANSKNKNLQRLSKRLEKLLDYDIFTAEETAKGTAGSYDYANRNLPKLNIKKGRSKEDTEETIIHEALHAAIVPRINSIELFNKAKGFIDRPEQAADPVKQMNKEWNDYQLETYRNKLKEFGTSDEAEWDWENASEQQSYYDRDEFFVRALVDPEFQDKLTTMSRGLGRGDKVPLWEKVGASLGLTTTREPYNRKDYVIENANRLIDVLQDIPPNFDFTDKIEEFNNR